MASEGDTLTDTSSAASPAADAPRDIPSGWEQRILQLDGKRYSLRLEPEFWSALEAIATRRKLRLNRLVAEVAARRSATVNLSSAVRTFCLGEIERSAAARSVALDAASIAALIENAPAPGLVLDAEQIVLAVNDAFLHWSGIKRALVLRQKLARHFRFQGASTFDDLWTRPAREEQTRIVGIMPGRVLAAEVTLVPLLGARGRRLCGLWVRA
ncbi:MAG TPA: ribbon-helix-helix domain-containing protein [Stellaceae bacterium]|nr:ribbon-helix-helix domain-containing protein [Stellaceae bacterium]